MTTLKAQLTALWENSLVRTGPGEGVDRVFVEDRSGITGEVESALGKIVPAPRALVRKVEPLPGNKPLDLSVVRLEQPAMAAGVYTRSLTLSPAVKHCRRVTSGGVVQLICVIAKNASVFSPDSEESIQTIVACLAEAYSVAPEHILISCTGVIGRKLPTREICAEILTSAHLASAETMPEIPRAILTTDKREKIASLQIGDLVVTGYAKGAGMIQPNMATMLVYLYTNARVVKPDLDRCLKRACDATFNRMSVDTDTSTSDTVVLLSTQQVDAPNLDLLGSMVQAVCLNLAQKVACESEGATKLLEVTVALSTSEEDATFFAKKVVNSPLVKTAIHGGDPNWGRVVMAIGKPDPGSPLLTIDPREVVIQFQGIPVYNRGTDITLDLPALSRAIRRSTKVAIGVEIGTPAYRSTVWGCDLSAEYVKENADYTT